MSELAKRVAVAAVGIPLVAVAAYIGGWVLAAVLALFAGGGALEVCRIAEARGVRPFRLPAVVTAGALVLIAAFTLDPIAAAPAWSMLWLMLLLGATAAAIWRRGPEGRPLGAVGVTLFAALLCGGTLAYGVFLRHMLPDGPGEWIRFTGPALPSRHAFDAAIGAGADLTAWTGVALLGFPLVLTWINDSAAYFAGKAWGRRKLIPSVSPGKTVVGSVAGAMAALVFGVVFAEFILSGPLGLPIGWLGGALAALAIAAAAQVGDLAESLLKREAGVKDSGTLFPGHGGILDRLDALLFAFPVGYWSLLIALAPDYLSL